jgi:hypothetical protein
VAGKTPPKAIRAFREPIQRALSCFAAGKVTADCYEPGGVGVLTFNRNEPVALPGAAKLRFDILMRYVIVPHEDKGPWKVSTTGWIYQLHSATDELVAGYHWHPHLTPDIVHPHVHVADDKTHFPTGRVLIEDFLQLAIERGAVPVDEAKWARVSKKNRADFVKGATWGVGPSVPTV